MGNNAVTAVNITTNPNNTLHLDAQNEETDVKNAETKSPVFDGTSNATSNPNEDYRTALGFEQSSESQAENNTQYYAIAPEGINQEKFNMLSVQDKKQVIDFMTEFNQAEQIAQINYYKNVAQTVNHNFAFMFGAPASLALIIVGLMTIWDKALGLGLSVGISKGNARFNSLVFILSGLWLGKKVYKYVAKPDHDYIGESKQIYTNLEEKAQNIPIVQRNTKIMNKIYAVLGKPQIPTMTDENKEDETCDGMESYQMQNYLDHGSIFSK